MPILFGMRTILPLLLFASAVVAQSPPKPLPSSVAAPKLAQLPRDENLVVIDLRSIRIQHLAQRLVITNNNQVFREFNTLSGDDEAMLRLLRDQSIIRWGSIGQSRIVIEYGLSASANGEPVVSPNAGFPKTVQGFDLKTLKVESIKGAWCVRDNAGPFLNFGQEKLEADQAVAVCKKYGFNRIGTVGKGPATTYFFAAPEGNDVNTIRGDVLASRSGIEVPGVGYLGERFAIDPKKLEVHRENNVVVVRHGSDLLAKFGNDESVGRDLVRAIEHERLTDICHVDGATFFLRDGKAIAAPHQARTARFDLAQLKVKSVNGQWAVTDGAGKPIQRTASEAEANELIRVLKAFNMDTVAAIGSTSSASFTFFSKSR